MRIVGGLVKGRRLHLTSKNNVRPTSERVREALFDILGQNLDDVSFLDICSGSGAISFEALSRRAVRVVAIDNDKDCCENIEKVSVDLGLEKRIEVLQGDARQILRDLVMSLEKFDIVFFDPPWSDKELAFDILKYLLCEKDFWKVFVFEFDKNFKISDLSREISSSIKEIRRYGRTNLLFF